MELLGNESRTTQENKNIAKVSAEHCSNTVHLPVTDLIALLHTFTQISPFANLTLVLYQKKLALVMYVQSMIS